MLDFETPDAFGLIEMTDAINKQKYAPGFLSAQGLFQERGIRTKTIAIEEKEGVLKLLATAPRGGGPIEGKVRTRRKLRTFEVPHIPDFDYIQADELQSVRAFATESDPLAFDALRDERLGNMATNLDYTLEYHRLGAIKGQILDADGSVLINLFDEFDVDQQAEVDLDLDNANPVEGALIKKVQGIKRTMIGALDGTPAGSIHCLCGDGFWDDLISHPDAREFYRRAQTNKLADAPVYSSFFFGDVTWWNYRGAGPVAIDTNKCNFYFKDIPGLFVTRYAPAPYFATVNQVGKPRYAKARINDWDTEAEFKAESNPINLCTRPNTLLQGRRT